MLFKIVLLVLLAYSKSSVKSDSYEDALISSLYSNYEPKGRPSLNHNTSTLVHISLVLSQITDVDERNQVLSTYSHIILSWIDVRLTWDPKTYNNLRKVILPAETIWRPDIILFNAAEQANFQADYQYVIVTSGGEVAWAPHGQIKTRCTLDVKYFPFDVQNCSIEISSSTYFIDQIDFVIENLFLEYFIPNTEWTLTNNSFSKKYIKDPFPVTVVSFNLVLERKPLFFVFNLILPCAIILAVAFLAFLVPLQSGEKMSIGITTLLSIVVLLLVVADQLPPTSDTIPLISVFYGLSTLIIAFICLMSVFTLNIHHYGEQGQPIPTLFQTIFFTTFAKIILFPRRVDLVVVRSKKVKHEVKDNDENNVESENHKNNETSSGDCNNKIIKKIFCKNNAVRPRNEGEEPKEDVDTLNNDSIQIQWTLLADIIDRITFYVLFILSLIVLFYIINQAPNAKLFY